MSWLDPVETTYQGVTENEQALLAAILQGDAEKVRQLCTQPDVDLHRKVTRHGEGDLASLQWEDSFLCTAAELGHEGIVRELVSAGARVNLLCRDRDGFTPLIRAIVHDQVSTVTGS